MKKITIHSKSNPLTDPVLTKQRMYSVFLGTGKTNYFNSNKEALAFLAETNRNLNLWLHSLNSQYAELFVIYRHCWFYFLDRSKGVNRLQVENQITVSFKVVDSALNHCITHTSGFNGNVNAFNFLFNALDQMLNICDSLREILLIRNELVNRYRIDVISMQLEDLRSRIDAYGIPEDKKSQVALASKSM